VLWWFVFLPVPALRSTGSATSCPALFAGLLVTQAHIYDSIVRFHRDNAPQNKLTVRPILESNRIPLYWRRNPTDIQRLELDAPFGVAEAYLKKWIKCPLFDSTVIPTRIDGDSLSVRSETSRVV
jgi:hypothetical protein